MGMLTTFKPQRTAVKRCKNVRHEAALVVLFVPLALCCKLPPGGSPVEMALLRIRGGGAVLPLSNIGSCSFMHPCEGDSDLWGIYSELCPQFTSWFHLISGLRQHQVVACTHT